MNKENAKKIVESALDARFDDNNFKIFISNLLKTPDLSQKPPRYENINEQFKAVISECLILGHYKDDQKNKIDILKVLLHAEYSLDKARTTQRNFISNYLKNSGSEAAIVAFITPELGDWRFSLVKLEYIIEVENSKLITKDEVTPAKRWSFLVGESEGCHTAISRFVPILESDIKPNLDEIENAFNIEQVTDEFYKKYKDLFLRMKEELDVLVSSDKNIKNDFQSKNIKTEDFAKKTMGQLAFLYFLQKKGWFGIKPKEKWGTGSKTFLRDLFNDKARHGANYFNDILEWFFYEALSQDRGNDSIYKKFNCRIPFLNGGLFEPMNGYSWETTDIVLDDKLFSNQNQTPEGDIGDGILDIFDRYNFTVNESEPLEKEVAVDPEMLGKVFENLLGITDRKSKGAFYTPREIVHYICQESLILYLYNEFDATVPINDLRSFILTGEIKNLSQNLKSIDKYLRNIKICDPAVGSGAFPLGMLNEIVKARQIVSAELKNDISKYQLKLDAVSNSLYGVDLDSGAIEIAKLRMWLSLAVDEDEPKPLPNLDHKMVQGNSLISKLHGIEIFDNEFIRNLKLNSTHENIILGELENLRVEYLEEIRRNKIAPKVINQFDRKIALLEKKLVNLNKDLEKKENFNLFEDQNTEISNTKILDLKNKVKLYLSTTNRSEKENLKKDIDTIKWDLIELSLTNDIDSEYLALIRSLRAKNEKPFFIWELEFNEVFSEKDGFDVVIGNPPYVQIQKFSGTTTQSNLEKENYQTFSKYGDLYCLFYERGISILKPKGSLHFITSNKWLRAGYGEKVRDFFLKLNPILLADLGPKVFDSATVDTCIFHVKNEPNANSMKAITIDADLGKNVNLNKYIFDNSILIRDLTINPWSISNESQFQLKQKAELIGVPLKKWDLNIAYGIKTGLNKAFIINEDIKKLLVKENSAIDIDIIKPILRGRDVNRFSIKFNGFYMIVTKFGSYKYIETVYPVIYKYLSNFKELLQKRGQCIGTRTGKSSTNDYPGQHHWLELDNNPSESYLNLFHGPKLIFQEIVQSPQFYYDAEGIYYCEASTFFATGKNLKYLTGLLNSKAVTFLFKNFYSGGGLGSSGYRYKKRFLELLPIPEYTSDIEASRKIEELVDEIQTNKKSDKSTKEQEKALDFLVYSLYKFTNEEIEIIENFHD